MSKVNVLIVEDDLINQKSLKNSLKKYFSQTSLEPVFFIAHDYASVRKILIDFVMDIIILDVQIFDETEGKESSLPLIPEFKQNNENVNIIVCSSDDSLNEEGINLGADHAFSKQNLIKASKKDLKKLSKVIYPKEELVED